MKGLFTQGAAVLLREPVELAEVEALLLHEGGPVRSRRSASHWAMGEELLVLPFREEVNGYLAIDTTDRPWPDHMGDPEREPELFAAWTLGHFGPFTYPGSLERAAQQAWAWQAAGTAVAEHRAYLRLKVSYCFGVPDDAPVIPEDYDASWEIGELLARVVPLLQHPSPLCYFNPSGEILLDRLTLLDRLAWSRDTGHRPVDAYSNVRLFGLEDLPGSWALMDTVGMGQVDIRDHEAVFESDRYSPNDVANFLRNSTLYVLDNGEIIADGNTMDGPGGVRWRARTFALGLVAPPRSVLRWFPEDGSAPPEDLLRERDGA